MNYFLVPVQEMGVKMPAPVREVYALAAAAAPPSPPPPPPCLSVELHGMFNCEPSSPFFHTLVQQISAEFVDTLVENLLPCSSLLTPRKARTKTCYPKKLNLESMKSLSNMSVYVAPVTVDEEEAHTQQVVLPGGESSFCT